MCSNNVQENGHHNYQTMHCGLLTRGAPSVPGTTSCMYEEDPSGVKDTEERNSSQSDGENKKTERRWRYKPCLPSIVMEMYAR